MDIDFNKNNDGLVPAIIQDSTTKNILTLLLNVEVRE